MLKLLSPTSDFHRESGPLSGRHAERLSILPAAGWMKADQTLSAKPLHIAPESVYLLGGIEAWGGQMALSFPVGAGVRFHCGPRGQHIC